MFASFVAIGDINPSRFVTLSPAASGQVAQSKAAEVPYGISSAASRSTPLPGLATPLAAIAGDNIAVFKMGDVCELSIAGTVAAGDYLSPDANGLGIKTTTDKLGYGARALSPGVAGQRIPVVVTSGFYAA